MADFTISIDDHPQGFVVHMGGEASFEAAHELEAALDGLLELIGEKRTVVVLEMSDLTFVSSLGMGLVIRFRGQVKHLGGSVRMAGLRPEVRSLFETSRLDWIVPVFESVDAAFAAGG